MEDLKFPVIKKALPEGKRLSMDEYAKFVFLHLKYTLDKKEYRKNKMLTAINNPFFLH